MEVFLFFILSYGITNIVIFSSLFNPLRNFLYKLNPNFLGELFSCPLCFSTWVGFLLSTIFHLLGYTQFSPFGHYGIDIMLLAIFFDGCLSSGMVWLIHTIQEGIESLSE